MQSRTMMGAWVLVALVTFSARADTIFTASLTGDQEFPDPVVTNASGTATLVLNNDETVLSITIEILGLDLDGNQTLDDQDDVLAMHIHRAPAGDNGDVVFGFISPNHDTDGDLVIDAAAGKVTSQWDLTEGNPNLPTTLADELVHLKSQGLYINVHTRAHTGGEIRGQIIPEPASAAILIGCGALCIGWRRSDGVRNGA